MSDFSGGEEVRTLLTAMVYDRGFLARIVGQWGRGGLFESDWANMIGGWCVSHFKRFGLPIDSTLVVQFENWSDNRPDDDPISEAIKDFLRVLPEESTSDTEYLLDLAGRHFGRVRLERTLDAVDNELSEGRYEAAMELVEGVRRVNLGQDSFIEPLTDYTLWNEAFEDRDIRKRSMIRYPGAAGEFFRGAFARGEFYSWMGPDKTGKTTFLMDAAYRALRQGRKVAVFDTGDGNEFEVILKLALRSTRTTEPGLVSYSPISWEPSKDPKDLEPDEEVEWFLERSETRRGFVESIDSFRGLRKVVANEKNLRISAHPNSTLSAVALGGILEDWQSDGWRPDVVVVDYADILAPPPGFSGHQARWEGVDETWRVLRKINQKFNNLLLTATQSNSAAYGNTKALLNKTHFSGSKGKLAHVNGMIGINVSDDERDAETARLNWVARRKALLRGPNRRCVYIAGCFDSCEPVILSHW